jgi:hypothetical protein
MYEQTELAPQVRQWEADGRSRVSGSDCLSETGWRRAATEKLLRVPSPEAGGSPRISYPANDDAGGKGPVPNRRTGSFDGQEKKSPFPEPLYPGLQS